LVGLFNLLLLLQKPKANQKGEKATTGLDQKLLLLRYKFKAVPPAFSYFWGKKLSTCHLL
jgi:hypothetical protein